MEEIKEERDEITFAEAKAQCAKQPDGAKEDEINIEDITTDVENIQVECKKINCSPVMNVIKGIYKLFCDLFKCFKFKSD